MSLESYIDLSITLTLILAFFSKFGHKDAKGSFVVRFLRLEKIGCHGKGPICEEYTLLPLGAWRRIRSYLIRVLGLGTISFSDEVRRCVRKRFL